MTKVKENPFIRAYVNGKKAAFLYRPEDNKFYLLSYVRSWNDDGINQIGENNLPVGCGFSRRSFHYIKIIYTSDFNDNIEEDTWDSVSRYFLRLNIIESVVLEGSEQYNEIVNRVVTRRRNNANNSTITQPVIPDATYEHESIDFYNSHYSTNHIYQGRNGYHTSHASGYLNRNIVGYTGYKIGVELEVVTPDRDAFDSAISKKSNWFTRESDGSIGSLGIEYITVPLIPDDARNPQTWNGLIDFLKSIGAKSWNTGTCGLHVHIGREMLGDTEYERQMTLGKTLLFYQGVLNGSSQARKVFGREFCYRQPNEKTKAFETADYLGWSTLNSKQVFDVISKKGIEERNSNRYFAINTTNAQTIEFRKGKGSINVSRIIAIITYCESIINFCKQTQEIDKLTEDNFQTWIKQNIPNNNPLMMYLGFLDSDV